MNNLQAVTVIIFVVCGLFLLFDRASDWSRHNEHLKKFLTFIVFKLTINMQKLLRNKKLLPIFTLPK